jgi:hypothetical protein
MKMSKDKMLKIVDRRDLPVKILRTLEIDNVRMEDIHNIPIHLCGTYIVLTRDEKNYVGSTTNFLGRLREHLYQTVKGSIPKFVCLFETENINDAKILGKWMIYRFNPSLNQQLRTKFKPLNDKEVLLLRKNVEPGHVRRKGLYDGVKSNQSKEWVEDA